MGLHVLAESHPPDRQRLKQQDDGKRISPYTTAHAHGPGGTHPQNRFLFLGAEKKA